MSLREAIARSVRLLWPSPLKDFDLFHHIDVLPGFTSCNKMDTKHLPLNSELLRVPRRLCICLQHGIQAAKKKKYYSDIIGSYCHNYVVYR